MSAFSSRPKMKAFREGKEKGSCRPKDCRYAASEVVTAISTLTDWNTNLHFVNAKWLQQALLETTSSVLSRLGLEKAVQIHYPALEKETIREIRAFVESFDPVTRVVTTASRGPVEITADLLRKALQLKESSEVYKKKRLQSETDDLFEKRMNGIGNGYRIEKCKYEGWKAIMRVVNRLLLGSSKPETVSGDVAYFYKALLLEGGNPPWAELVLESLVKEVRLLKHHISKLESGDAKSRPHPFYACHLVSYISRHVGCRSGGHGTGEEAEGIRSKSVKQKRQLSSDCERYDLRETRSTKRRLVRLSARSGDVGGGNNMPPAVGVTSPSAAGGDEMTNDAAGTSPSAAGGDEMTNDAADGEEMDIEKSEEANLGGDKFHTPKIGRREADDAGSSPIVAEDESGGEAEADSGGEEMAGGLGGGSSGEAESAWDSFAKTVEPAIRGLEAYCNAKRHEIEEYEREHEIKVKEVEAEMESQQKNLSAILAEIELKRKESNEAEREHQKNAKAMDSDMAERQRAHEEKLKAMEAEMRLRQSELTEAEKQHSTKLNDLEAEMSDAGKEHSIKIRNITAELKERRRQSNEVDKEWEALVIKSGEGRATMVQEMLELDSCFERERDMAHKLQCKVDALKGSVRTKAADLHAIKVDILKAARKKSGMLKSIPAGPEQRRLVVLDLNGVLIRISDPTEFKRHGISCVNVDSRGQKAFVTRKHMVEFLELLGKECDVGIWTSRTLANTQALIEMISPGGLPNVAFILTQENCQSISSKAEKGGLLHAKPLSEILQGGHWTGHGRNVLIVDDSPAKMAMNHPHQAVCPKTWVIGPDMCSESLMESELATYILEWVRSPKAQSIYEYQEKRHLPHSHDILEELNTYFKKTLGLPNLRNNPVIFSQCSARDRERFIGDMEGLGKGK